MKRKTEILEQLLEELSIEKILSNRVSALNDLRLKTQNTLRIKSVAVNSSSYLNEDAKKIPVDEKFLYDFLQKRRHLKDSDNDESDNESVTSEDFEQYLDSFTGTKAAQESDEELDYLAEMEAAKQKRPSKGDQLSDDELGKGDDDEDDEIGELSGDEDGSDGELNISGDENEPVLSGDEDELLLEDSDEDEQIGVPGEKSGKGKNKLKLKGSDDLSSLFASAEEFSTLLEETASNKKQGSSQAVSNTDNASKKQLAWEENRDRWIKGYNRKILGHKANKKIKRHISSNFKGNANKMADKKGGKRKGGNFSAGGKKRKIHK